MNINFFYFIIGYIIFFFLSLLFHELGHLVFGLASGYKFNSFSYLSFLWYKKDNHIKLGKSNGLALGQCLMEPPANEEDFHYILSNIGGGLMNIIIAGVFMIMMLTTDNELLFSLASSAVVLNVFFGLVNLIPFSNNIPNDGMNVLKAMSSPEAKHAFFLMIDTHVKLSKGMRMREFDHNAFILPPHVDRHNYLMTSIIILESQRLYDLNCYQESFEMLNQIDLKQLPLHYANSIRLALLYHYIIHHRDIDKARGIYEYKNFKRILTIKLPGITRIKSAYYFFILNNKKQGISLLNKAKEENLVHPNLGSRRMEEDYLNKLEQLFMQEV